MPITLWTIGQFELVYYRVRYENVLYFQFYLINLVTMEGTLVGRY